MENKELEHLIDRSLKAEPTYKLPADFALKLSGVIVRRRQWRTDLREYFSIVVVVVGLLSVAGGIYYLANKEIFGQMLDFVSNNLIPFILIAFILNFILFADRVLLRLMFSRWNKS